MMGDADTITWTGESGRGYKYCIYLLGQSLKDEGGNYIFARETSPNRWEPVYIGQTESLKDRLSYHEKEARAESNCATDIHVHLNSDQQARLTEEKDLIVKWRPPCND